MTRGVGIKPGHIGWKRVLSQLLHPCKNARCQAQSILEATYLEQRILACEEKNQGLAILHCRIFDDDTC